MQSTASSSSEAASGWGLGLHRSFQCAGRHVSVTLLPLWREDGSPVWELEWSAPPLRLLPSDLQTFDASLKQAKAEILAAAEKAKR